MSERKRRMGLGAKMNAAILSALVVGFGLVSGYLGWALVNSHRRLTDASLERAADLLAAAVENLMLPGEAPIAVAFFDEVARVDARYSVALYRRDGSGAFSDDSTAAAVNARLGTPRFPLEMRRPAFPPPDPEAVAAAAATPPADHRNESEAALSGGSKARVARLYRPLVNLPKCVACHGGDHTVRGMVSVAADVSAGYEERRSAAAVVVVLFAAMASATGVGLSRFLRRTIVAPVRLVGEVCERVGKGDFSGRVEWPADDEAGDLAARVNEMTSGLRERAELAKYVSGSTISAVRGDQRGRRERRVLLFSDVRGFTAFSEARPAEEVVRALNRILDLQTRAIHAAGGDVDKFVGDEVVAVFGGDGAEERACAAALELHRAVARAAAEPGAPALAVGAGIAAGDVVYGMIGSADRADFTVIGDSVNTAARLCAAAKAGSTLVHESAARALAGGGSGFVLEGPYGIELKGKKGKQAVYLLKEGGAHG